MRVQLLLRLGGIGHTSKYLGQSSPASVLLAALLILLSGCATQRGTTEFAAYRSGYQITIDAGNAILDQLAVAEREANDLVTGPISTAEKVKFDPDKAAYYSSAVDPPATAAFRRSLRALEIYNEALYGLASGQYAEVIAARISELGAVGASAAISVTGGATRFDVAVAGINTAIKAFEPMTAFAFGFKTRAEFRERLLQHSGTMKNILQTTRNGTVEIYNVLFARMIDESIKDPVRLGELTDKEKARAEDVRALLSNWVILLEGSSVMLDVAVAATMDDSGSGSAAGLVATGTQLEVAAREARRNLAESAN